MIYFALVPENLSNIKGAASYRKMLILVFWPLHKFDLWFLNKETI